MTPNSDSSSSVRHSVSVAGVVQDELGRVLLIRRADNGEWEIPGGVLGLDEELHEALVREVLEETGLRVTPGQLTGVYKNMSQGIVALVFRCTPVGGKVAPSAEALDVQWIEARALASMVSDRIRIRIKDALRDFHTTAVRDHSHPVEAN